MEIDDENFYDPLEKDLDNDGIPDRYDNDFKTATILSQLMMWRITCIPKRKLHRKQMRSRLF